MRDILINSDTAKLARQKNILNSSKFSYYIILGDTYYKDHHKGDEYLAYKENEIICRTEPPFQTNCLEIGNAYTQSSLQTHLRDVHDIHIQILIHSWSERTYYYKIHSKRAYVSNSSKFILDSDVVIGKYVDVLEKALHHGLNLIKE